MNAIIQYDVVYLIVRAIAVGDRINHLLSKRERGGREREKVYLTDKIPSPNKY